MRSILPVFAVLPLLSACVSNGAHYEPIVDAPADSRYYADLGACQALAERRDLVDGETVNRAALGAGIGAAAGAIRRGGDTLEDAAVGAAVGGAVGGATGLYDANRERKDIVMRCMSGRGYRVLG